MKDKKYTGRKGLEFLKQRDSLEKLSVLEVYDIPTKFKLFLEYYKVGDSKEMFGEGGFVSFKNLPSAKISGCYIIFHSWFEGTIINGEQYQNHVDSFLSIEQLIEEFEKHRLQVNEWHEENFVHIGYMENWGDMIFLGMSSERKDQIWIRGDGTGTNLYTKIADNIFDFFSAIREYFTDEDLKDYTNNEYVLKDVFKICGDEFWSLNKL